MKISANSNIYEVTTENVLAAYEPFVEFGGTASRRGCDAGPKESRQGSGEEPKTSQRGGGKTENRMTGHKVSERNAGHAGTEQRADGEAAKRSADDCEAKRHDDGRAAERSISRLFGLALSSEALGETAREAVGKSLQALGYGAGSCAFATMKADGLELGEQELLFLVEGIDPVCLIVCDARCAGSLGKAYRTQMEPDDAGHLLGRPYVSFSDFESLMETPEKKQKAWALLKRLPKMP